MKETKMLLVAILTFAISVTAFAKKGKGGRAAQKETNVLIVGLEDNVKSNYYYNQLIAKETGLNEDSVDLAYNNMIAENIAAADPESFCHFVSANGNHQAIATKIQVDGEGESCNSSLDQLSQQELQTMLEQSNSEYLLVLNQHYLKREVQPMRTIFYIISYSLYDKNKQQVYNGNQYFTIMELQSAEKMAQLSRKSASKIAASIEKSLL